MKHFKIVHTHFDTGLSMFTQYDTVHTYIFTYFGTVHTLFTSCDIVHTDITHTLT